MAIQGTTRLAVLLALVLVVVGCGSDDKAAPASVADAQVETAQDEQPLVDEAEQATRRYEGVVLDESGQVVPEALLTFGWREIEVRVRADRHGRFDVSVPVNPKHDAWWLVPAAPCYYEFERRLPIGGATGLKVVLHQDRNRGSVVVRVVTPDGQPAARAWVSVGDGPVLKARIGGPFTLRRWFPSHGLADAQGRFVTHGIRVCKNTVEAQHGDYVAVVTMPMTWPKTEIEVVLQAGRTLRGYVRAECPEGCARDVHDVRLSVRHEDSFPEGWWPSLRTQVKAGSEASVPFEIRGAPLYALDLLLSTDCHETLRVEVGASSAPETVDVGEIVLTDLRER